MLSENTKPFEPYWLDEKDWLVYVEYLPEDDKNDRARGAQAIGYLLAYSRMTDTRMLALIGDEDAGAYELLFSFSSPAGKARFLDLMRSNELTSVDDAYIGPPTADEIKDARPLSHVLPEDVLKHVSFVALLLSAESDSDQVN